MKNICTSTGGGSGGGGAVTLLEYKLLVGRNLFHGLGDSLGVLSDMFWSWILIYGEELDQAFVAMHYSNILGGYKT